MSEKATTIRIFRTPAELRPYRNALPSHNRTVGLVPTMGALHEGHLKLARHAAADNDEVFVTIYVNPTQFGVNEDFGSYPRTWVTDLEKLEHLNQELLADTRQYKGHITAVFAPTTKTMYPNLPPSSEIDGHGTFVNVTPLGKLLEGASRPVFFRGVATVCTKLFNIIRPESVYFGQKDIQQTAVIRRLVSDLHMDISVRIIPTEREADGLAMSSRNVYLGERRRRAAIALPTSLRMAEAQYMDHGETSRGKILRPALEYIEAQGVTQAQVGTQDRVAMKLDYISLADPESMEEIDAIDGSRGAVLSAALLMLPLEESRPGEDLGESGGASRVVRLIDNIILPPRNAKEALPKTEEARIDQLENVVERTEH